MAKLPNAFKAARQALGMSQQEVAKKTGIAQSVISDLETGKNTNPSWDVLSKLSRVYNKRPEELIPRTPLPGTHKHNARPIVRTVVQVSA